MYQSPKILHGRDAILRVRNKLLVFNILQLWADVKYHVPTGFFAEGERFLSFWRCHRPHWGGRRWCCGVADSSICLKSDCHSTNDRCEALASLKGCFLCFLFRFPQYFSTEPSSSPAFETCRRHVPTLWRNLWLGGGRGYLTMNFLAVPLAKRAT